MISSPLVAGEAARQREFGGHRLRRKGRARDESIVQRTIPPALEVRAGVLRLPVALGQLVAGCLVFIGQELDQLALAMSAIKRSNQRLNKAHRAVEGAGIAPLLQVVSSAHVPVAILRGFILIEPEMHPQSNFVQRVQEVQVRRCVIHRIGVEHQQHVHFAAVHLGRKLAKLLQLRSRRKGIDRIGVAHRLSYRAQRRVDGMRQCVRGRSLRIAHHHHGCAAVGLQILDQRGGKLLLPRLELTTRLGNAQAQWPGRAQTAPPRSPSRAADDRLWPRCWWSRSPPRRSAASPPSAQDGAAAKTARVYLWNPGKPAERKSPSSESTTFAFEKS